MVDMLPNLRVISDRLRSSWDYDTAEMVDKVAADLERLRVQNVGVDGGWPSKADVERAVKAWHVPVDDSLSLSEGLRVSMRAALIAGQPVAECGLERGAEDTIVEISAAAQ